LLGIQGSEIDADQAKFVGKLVRAGEVIERRHDQALGQVAGGAENHHRARRGRGCAGDRIGFFLRSGAAICFIQHAFCLLLCRCLS
jgi:hypothetical protein